MPRALPQKRTKSMNIASLLGCALLAVLSAINGVGQTTAPAKTVATDAEIAVTEARMTALRDTFVKATVDAGFTCPIAPPKILVVDVPSFGSYDPETNTLKTPSWGQMTDAERGLFYRVLGPGATETAARGEFEEGTHHWVFVHELGHWWQACRGIVKSDKHYRQEFGANRIAAAYWQERDPAVIRHQRSVFEAILKRPNPVPEGQSVEPYFDANYEKLGPTPAYIWFQARMCITAFDEKPEPTFTEALKQTTL